MPVSRCRRPAAATGETWTQQVGAAAPSTPRVTMSFTTASSSSGEEAGLSERNAATPVSTARRQVSGPGISRSSGLRRARQPVQVRLDLPRVAGDGEHGLENPVAAGGAQVRGHQLRLFGVGNRPF